MTILSHLRIPHAHEGQWHKRSVISQKPIPLRVSLSRCGLKYIAKVSPCRALSVEECLIEWNSRCLCQSLCSLQSQPTPALAWEIFSHFSRENFHTQQQHMKLAIFFKFNVEKIEPNVRRCRGFMLANVSMNMKNLPLRWRKTRKILLQGKLSARRKRGKKRSETISMGGIERGRREK